MSDLPAGFVLDALPPGFVVDKPTKPPRKQVGVEEGTKRAFAGGVTFNLIDEAVAALKAWGGQPPAWAKAVGMEDVSSAPTWNERYTEELAKERDKAKSFDESNPAWSMAGNVAGGVANAALTLPALPASLVSRSVSPVVNVLKSGTTGAVAGGVAGYGAGEGDNREGNALMGATIGGVVGGVTPPLLAAGNKLMATTAGRYVSDKLITPVINVFSRAKPAPRTLSSAAADGGNTLPPSMVSASDEIAGNAAQRAAIERIATDMQRSGRSPESFLRLVDRYGPEAVLADLDEQFLRTAVGVRTAPGETRTVAKTVLESRDKAAGQRVTSAFEGDQPPPSTFALRGEGQGFDQNLHAVGQRVYGEMEEAGLKQTPELMAIYKNPDVAAAIERTLAAEKRTRIGTDRTPASPVEIMHKVKQAIWDLGFNKDTARPGPDASWYRDLGIRYMDRLKAANPKLAEADLAYSQAAKLPEFFDAGRNFLAGGQGEKAMNSSAPALDAMLANATEQQALASRAGTTNAVRELTGGRNALSQTRALTRDIEMSPNIRDTLVVQYGPQRAMEIMRRAEAENVFAGTSNRILRGPQTAANLYDAADVGAAMPIPTGASPTNLLAYGKAFIDWTRQPNEAIRDAIGRALLNPNTAENRRLLQMAAEIAARRRSIGPVRTGLAEGAGNVTRD